MEEEFRVIDNYLMVRMPVEVDHHASEYSEGRSRKCSVRF